MLTIAIPTYNRNNLLNKHLRLLLPQLQTEPNFYRLILSDNCSPIPIADTLVDVMRDFPEITYQVIRNKQNIGANANIMRCFEQCETKWIWVMSDDDPVAPDAVITIRQHLRDYPDCVYFNFPYDNARQQTFFTVGVDELIARLDNSANLPWISSAIHRTANIQVNLKYGYQFAYAMLPHVAALLMSLGQQGKCCLSATKIMGVHTESTSFANHWSIVTFALGSPVIYDLPLAFSTRKALANKLLVTYKGESIDLRVVIIQLLLAYFEGNEHTERFDRGNLLYAYNQIVKRNYYLRNRFSRLGFKILYYRVLLHFPRLIVRILPSLGNSKRHGVPRQDRYERV